MSAVNAALSVPDAEAQRWCHQCSCRLNELEPRLASVDCDDLSNSLWQLDSYQRMHPHSAAEHFMAENQEMLAIVLPAD